MNSKRKHAAKTIDIVFSYEVLVRNVAVVSNKE